MAVGLSVNRLIAVTVNLSAVAVSVPNLNALLIAGPSAVIDTNQRIREYNSIAQVATDFGTSAPEYLAAVLYFGQAPKPATLYIGRWAKTATNGLLRGGALTAAEQALSNFTSVTSGGFQISVNGGAATNVTGLNFSAQTSLNGVASVITAALTGATCTWNGSQFVFQSSTTGASSSIGFLTDPGSGAAIQTLLKGTAATGATTVQGIIAETPAAAAAIFDATSTSWYALTFADPAAIANNLHLAVSAYIEAAENPHMYGATTQEAGAIDPASTTDLAYLTKAAGYLRTTVQYSSSSPYAVASLFGRILTTNFNANRSMITLMYKQEPGVTAETLTPTAASALQAKSANVFVNYANGSAIIQYGTVASGAYFDEVYGADALKIRIQTDVFNLLYTSPTKVPQTDAGNNQIRNVISAACSAFVENGFIGAGTWTLYGFGQLKTGEYMPSGFYVYMPPISSQSQADREARKAVPATVAVKLAGAVHTASVVVNVNR